MEYELLFFTSVANEDRIGEIKKEILEILEGRGAKISVEFSDIGKRKFAHPIKKQTHGFFSFCRFTIEEKENLAEINRRLSLNDKLMRHLIVRADEIGKPVSAQMTHEPSRVQAGASEKRVVEQKTRPVETGSEKSTETKAKVGIEELDEKLSELLENPE